MDFRVLLTSEVQDILKKSKSYVDLNPRFAAQKFTEQYARWNRDLFPSMIWYGLFDGDSCKALSLLEKDRNGIILLVEIQSLVKGFGKILLDEILQKASNFWLAVDPNSGETLVEWYRQFDLLKEHIVNHSIWADGNEQHFFYKSSNEEYEKMILSILRRAESKMATT